MIPGSGEYDIIRYADYDSDSPRNPMAFYQDRAYAVYEGIVQCANISARTVTSYPVRSPTGPISSSTGDMIAIGQTAGKMYLQKNSGEFITTLINIYSVQNEEPVSTGKTIDVKQEYASFCMDQSSGLLYVGAEKNLIAIDTFTDSSVATSPSLIPSEAGNFGITNIAVDEKNHIIYCTTSSGVAIYQQT
jgi:hypothetical protein